MIGVGGNEDFEFHRKTNYFLVVYRYRRRSALLSSHGLAARARAAAFL